MDDLLTTKQLQDLLQVDRITVYRMIKDGRLSGIKIGNQWRFARQEVEALLSGVTADEFGPEQASRPLVSADVIPLGCVQAVQDVFAEMAGIGAVTTGADGQPLTELSNCSQFCGLILASESGRQACIASWRKLANQPEQRPKFVSCHAGLQYARARIEVNGQMAGLLIAGQFYDEPAEADAEKSRVVELAKKHQLDEVTLLEAAEKIPVLDDHKRAWLGTWLEKVAHTFEQVGAERANLMKRLRHIAEVSMFDSP
jgi:excisionase family DNA binding protein